MIDAIALGLSLLAANAGAAPVQPAAAFEQLKTLAGDWEADLPGFGKITNSIRLVSNGKAIEETIGTPADNEVSLYTRDGTRILLTHFCALTPDGHQARLEASVPAGAATRLVFMLRDTVNLRSSAAPHMRRVEIAFGDHDHFSEKWTKVENGKDTPFVLDFVRR
jgi:hypothetical protein